MAWGGKKQRLCIPDQTLPELQLQLQQLNLLDKIYCAEGLYPDF